MKRISIRPAAVLLVMVLLLCLPVLRAGAMEVMTVEQARAELRRLLIRYTERHPDVVRLKRYLEKLEAREEARRRAREAQRSALDAERARVAGRPRPPVRVSRPAPAVLPVLPSARRGTAAAPVPAPRAAAPAAPRALARPRTGITREERLKERRILQKALAADGVRLE